MSKVSNQQEDLLAEYGTATTAYLLMAMSIDSLEHRNKQLEDENAKLRELVRAAWRCIHTGASCSDCRLIAGGCTLQTAMHELGIEVD